MNAQDKYDLIWKQITDKIKEANIIYNISFELIDNTFNEFYVEDVNGTSNFFSVRPIIKQGKETYGVISCSDENELTTVFYHDYEEFEKVLNRWLSAVFKEENTIEHKAVELLNEIDFTNWKYPWMAKVVQLSLEYLTLEGSRDTDIPYEILDICEIVLKEN